MTNQAEFNVEVVADSLNTANGIRLTTMLWTYPRIIHGEVMTHRMLCRNSASSRAIPWEKVRREVVENPFIPIRFGGKKSGMQMSDGNEVDQELARKRWLEARNYAVDIARDMANEGVHKSIVNRLVEPWMWMRALITATDWENLWALRIHKDAEIHFEKIAKMAREAMEKSKPREIGPGLWHVPFVDVDDRYEIHRRMADRTDEEFSEALAKISSARCARLSYLTHDGKRDIDADLDRFARLNPPGEPMHASPMEHPCMAVESSDYIGPLRGWKQFRKMLPGEAVQG